MVSDKDKKGHNGWHSVYVVRDEKSGGYPASQTTLQQILVHYGQQPHTKLLHTNVTSPNNQLNTGQKTSL